MKEKILSSNTGGRLGNQLYFTLQAFVRNSLEEHWKYQTTNLGNKHCNLFQYADELNLSDIVTFNQKSDDVLVFCKYYQLYGQDYSEHQLHDFIKSTLAKSKAIRKHLFTAKQNQVGIHVRNGDYLNISATQCFDKRKYLESCFSMFDSAVDECFVFSDQIEICKQEFDSLLKTRFKAVIYENNSLIDDFAKFSTFKNKILWNSTFSYWSGYISDVLYPDVKICVPKKFTYKEDGVLRCNPKWTFV